MADESPELIEQEMQGTRRSLTDKVAALEQTVVGTIQSAADTVKETVDSVREAMSDTVSTVKNTVADVKDSVSDAAGSVSDGIKEAFDVRSHVRDNPIAAVGIAAAAGFLTGWLTGGGRAYGAPPPANQGMTGVGGFGPSYSNQAYSAPPPREPAEERKPAKRPGWLDDLLELAGQEISKLAKQALASATAAAKQNIEQGVPKLFERETFKRDENRGNVGGFRTGV